MSWGKSITALLLLAACTSGPRSDVPSTSPTSVSDLFGPAVPGTLVEGREVRLEVYAWLNLQPGRLSSEPGPVTSPLHVIVFLTPTDSISKAPAIDLSTVYLVRGDSVWSAFAAPFKLTAQSLKSIGKAANVVAFQVSGGPFWVLNADSVDVYARVNMLSSSDVVLLRAPRMMLERAY